MAEDPIGRALGGGGGGDEEFLVLADFTQPSGEVGGLVFDDGRGDAGVGAEERGRHLGDQLLFAIVGAAEGGNGIGQLACQARRVAGAVGEFMEEGRVLLLGGFEAVGFGERDDVGAWAVVGAAALAFDGRTVAVAFDDQFGAFDGVERVGREGRRIGDFDALALDGVKDVVLPRDGDAFDLVGLGVFDFVHLPEDDGGGFLAFLDGAAEGSGLVKGQPVVGFVPFEEGGDGEQKDVDPAIGFSRFEVLGNARGRLAKNGRPPGDNAPVEHVEDFLGDLGVKVGRAGGWAGLGLPGHGGRL